MLKRRWTLLAGVTVLAGATSFGILPFATRAVAQVRRTDPLSLYTVCVTAAYGELSPSYSNPTEVMARSRIACAGFREALEGEVQKKAGADTRRVLLEIDKALLRALSAVPAARAPDLTAPVAPPFRAPVAEDLPMSTCNLESGLRSREGTRASTLQFLNWSAEVRYLFWINYDGTRVRYATLAPGQSAVQNTYVTHPWVITDSAGRCRGIFMPAEQGGRALIR